MWVEKTKNGKFRMAERYKDYMTGKEKKVSVVMEKNTPATRKLAGKILEKKIDEIFSASSTTEEITLADTVEKYRAYQKETVKSTTFYRNFFATKSLLEILGEDVLLNRLTAAYINSCFLKLKESAGTKNERLVRLKAFIRWAYKNDYIKDTSCIDKLSLFKEEAKISLDSDTFDKIKEKYLEHDEIEKLMDAFSTDIWKLLFRFLILSGLRIGEALPLLKEDVDLKERYIFVGKTYNSQLKTTTTPKTFSSCRKIYIQDELLSLCKQIDVFMKRQQLLYGYEKSKLFFQNIRGKELQYEAFNHALKRASQESIHRNITPHITRHTHTSLLAEEGMSLEAIARRLGHSNSAITKNIYLHVTEKMRERDNEKIKNIKIF